MYGHLAMGICLALLGVCILIKTDVGMLICLNAFTISYWIGNGTIIWVYVSEIVVDSGLGICMFFLTTFILALALSTNYLMNSFL
jgi:hypothetical protein